MRGLFRTLVVVAGLAFTLSHFSPLHLWLAYMTGAAPSLILEILVRTLFSTTPFSRAMERARGTQLAIVDAAKHLAPRTSMYFIRLIPHLVGDALQWPAFVVLGFLEPRVRVTYEDKEIVKPGIGPANFSLYPPMVRRLIVVFILGVHSVLTARSWIVTSYHKYFWSALIVLVISNYADIVTNYNTCIHRRKVAIASVSGDLWLSWLINDLIGLTAITALWCPALWMNQHLQASGYAELSICGRSLSARHAPQLLVLLATVVAIRLILSEKGIGESFKRSPEHFAEIALSLCMLGRFDEALETATKGLTIDASNASSLRVAAAARFGSGNLKEAIDLATRAGQLADPTERGNVLGYDLLAGYTLTLPIDRRYLRSLLEQMSGSDLGAAEIATIFDLLHTHNGLEDSEVTMLYNLSERQPLVRAIIDSERWNLEQAECSLASTIEVSGFEELYRRVFGFRLRWGRPEPLEDKRLAFNQLADEALPIFIREVPSLKTTRNRLLTYSLFKWLLHAGKELDISSIGRFTGLHQDLGRVIRERGEESALLLIDVTRNPREVSVAKGFRPERRPRPKGPTLALPDRELSRGNPHLGWFSLGWFSRSSFLISSGLGAAAVSPLLISRRFWGCAVIAIGISALWLPLGVLILTANRAGRHKVRRPPAPLVCYVLSHHVLLHLMADAIWISLVYLCLLNMLGKHRALLWGLIVACPLISRLLLTNGTLVAIKHCLAQRFRIMTFRRFDAAHAQATRNVILPIFGSYGSNVVLRDESLEASRGHPNIDSEILMADLKGMRRYSEMDWDKHVRAELDAADLAVFHWSEQPTRAMLWEYEAAKERLPLSRLVFLCCTDSEPSFIPTDRGAVLVVGNEPSYCKVSWQVFSYMRDLRKG